MFKAKKDVVEDVEYEKESDEEEVEVEDVEDAKIEEQPKTEVEKVKKAIKEEISEAPKPDHQFTLQEIVDMAQGHLIRANQLLQLLK